MGDEMRLEITPSKEVMSKRFNPSSTYDNYRYRLDKHTVIVSNELIEIIEKDAEVNNYEDLFEEWFLSRYREVKKLKKVKINDINIDEEDIDGNDIIVIKTSYASDDKIVIGDFNSTIINKYIDVKFIPTRIFIKDKKQTVNLSDIDNVLNRNRFDKIFDIYETPIYIEVSNGGDSKVLAEYLSRFYANKDFITIKDTYLDNRDNERNLNNYILAYINKDSSKIRFLICWESSNKQKLESKYTNYRGYNSEINKVHDNMQHDSFIKTDDYKIDLGYRLKVFGDRDDDKTEHETITIVKTS